MTFLTLPSNIRLYYTTHGRTYATPLLLTHGYSATSAMWDAQIPLLSRHFLVIIWDMRGHGQTTYPTTPSSYSETHTISDMLALLNHVAPRRKAIVGGLSLGGYMSLAFHRVYPQRVKALLIIDTGPGFKSSSAREAWNKTANATASRFERDGLAPLQWPGVSAERSQAKHLNAKGLALAARGMLAQRDDSVILSLESIKVPCLVVVGAEDKPFLTASEYMVKKIKGCEKVVVAGAGHAVNIDQPEAFIEGILPFLRRVEGKARL